MRIFIATYIPIPSKKEPGDIVINSAGEATDIKDEYSFAITDRHWMRAELCLVTWEYNQQIIYGKISRGAKWINAGDKIREEDIEFYETINTKTTFPLKAMSVYKIRCNCGQFH